MKTFFISFAVLLASLQTFAFDGVVTYSQFDFVDKKPVPPITKKITVYFSDNNIRRLRIEFDPQKFKTSAYDTFIDYDKKKFTVLDAGSKSYVENKIDMTSTMKGELVSQGDGPVIKGQPTTNFTFGHKLEGARKTVISYSNKLKVEPIPYLHSILDAQSWGINPNTGAIAMRFFFDIDPHRMRVIQATDIAERKLNAKELTPDLTGLEKK